MEWLDAGLLRRATTGLKCKDSRLEAGMNEESTFMPASVYDRCSKGKLKGLELFWAAPPATPGPAAPGPTATTYWKVSGSSIGG